MNAEIAKLKADHFILWEIFQAAEAKYKKFLADWDSRYVALMEMDETASEYNAAVDKLVEDEAAAGKWEIHDAYRKAYDAMLDNAAKFLEMEFPKQWKQIEPLFSDPSNRIIYQKRILNIFANMGK